MFLRNYKLEGSNGKESTVTHLEQSSLSEDQQLSQM